MFHVVVSPFSCAGKSAGYPLSANTLISVICEMLYARFLVVAAVAAVLAIFVVFGEYFPPVLAESACGFAAAKVGMDQHLGKLMDERQTTRVALVKKTKTKTG